MRKSVIIFVCLASMAFGQATCKKDFLLTTNAGGQLVRAAGVRILVCASGDTSDHCKPLAIYADAAKQVPLSNPVTTDKNGNYSYCADPGDYNEQYSGTNVVGGNNQPVTLGATTQYVDAAAAGKANDGAVVHKTGDETIAGNKTFTGTVAAKKTVTTATDADASTDTLAVNTPGVFGYTPRRAWCSIAVPGGICYAGSFTTVDDTDGSGYTHTVGPQITVQQMHTPGSGRDVYGLPVGIVLAAGVHPGAGVRVERQTGTTGSLQPGQIAVAFDADTATTPVALFARAQCTTGSCESSAVKFTGMNGGTPTFDGSLSVDANGLLRVRPAGLPGGVVFDPVTAATDTANQQGQILYFPANAWSGSASFQHHWTVQHKVNGSGTLTADVLEIKPPSTTGAVTPYLAFLASTRFDIGVDTTGAGFKHKRFTASDAVGAVMCQTGSSVGSTCDNVFNVPGTAFADTDYTVACSVATTATGVPVVQQASATTTSTFTVKIAALTAAGAQASYVSCTLVHD